jgi:hypothetical protein
VIRSMAASGNPIGPDTVPVVGMNLVALEQEAPEAVDLDPSSSPGLVVYDLEVCPVGAYSVLGSMDDVVVYNVKLLLQR